MRYKESKIYNFTTPKMCDQKFNQKFNQKFIPSKNIKISAEALS